MILVGVDGTGVLDQAQYRAEMRNSFVSYICSHTPARHRRYWRGPTAEGSDTPFIVSEAYTWVHLLGTEDTEGVLLAGYSRGAAAAVAVAQRLRFDGVRVSGLMLFDCVDRAIGIDTAEVPDNVDEVLHVRRDPRSASRESFGNSGTVSRTPTVYRERFFMGTHGAMGGVPWRAPWGGPDPHPEVYIDEGYPDGPTRITFRRDLACATEIWGFVRPELQRMGFIP